MTILLKDCWDQRSWSLTLTKTEAVCHLCHNQVSFSDCGNNRIRGWPGEECREESTNGLHFAENGTEMWRQPLPGIKGSKDILRVEIWQHFVCWSEWTNRGRLTVPRRRVGKQWCELFHQVKGYGTWCWSYLIVAPSSVALVRPTYFCPLRTESELPSVEMRLVHPG